MPQAMPNLNAVNYQPRNPQSSGYYKCVESHFEELEQIWDDHYASSFGFWRDYVTKVIHRYLECGDLHFGFARVKCEECGHEYLLAFSCKRRHFCPSCHQKRVVEYSEWLLGEVLKNVPHRQWVFSIPKRIRIFFLYDRKLLSKLSRCGWNVIRTCLETTSLDEDAKPGASIAVHTYGDFLNFNPHVHAIVPDGCFLGDSDFRMAPMISGKDRMVYIPIEKTVDGVAKVIYTSKDGKTRKTFEALDWLAHLVTHIPGRYEQTVRYYGFYSNKSRGLRKKGPADGGDDDIPGIVENEMSSKEWRQNWARLIALVLHFVPENLRGRSPDMPEMPGGNEDYRLHRG